MENVGTVSASLENIQVNEDFPTDINLQKVKPWKDDLLLYYDFSNEDDLGRDVTGNGRNADYSQVEYASSVERTHSIRFNEVSIPVAPPLFPLQYKNVSIVEI